MIRDANLTDISFVKQSLKSEFADCACNVDTSLVPEYLKKDYFLIYLIDNERVGFIYGEKMLANGVFVHFFFVKPQYRSEGIGKLLWEEFERRHKNKNWIYLICPTLQAAKFYQRQGFVGDPSLEMIKRIK